MKDNIPTVSIQNVSMKYQSPEGEIEAIKNISLDVAQGIYKYRWSYGSGKSIC